MRVLLTNYFPLGAGGAESSTYLTAKALKKRGIEVFIASTEEYPGVKTFVFKKFRKIPFFYLQHAYLTRFLKKVISEYSIDIIHTQDRLTTVGGIKVAKESKIPVVSHFRDYWFACPLSTLLRRDFSVCETCTFTSLYRCVPKRRFLWEAYKLRNIKNVRDVLKTADKKIAISSKVKEKMEQHGFDGKILVLPNPVDVDFFSSANGEIIRRKYGLEGSPVVGFIGNLAYHKGTDILKRIIPKILEKKDVRFLVVGNGESKKELETELLDKRIIFTGKVDFEKIPEYYSACDILLIPSIWEEPFGRIAIEAMAAGKPVVASNVGGLADIVEDGRTGYFVEPDDIGEWIKKIEKLIDSKDLRERRGRQSFKTVKNVYDVGTISNTLIEIYQENIEHKKIGENS